MNVKINAASISLEFVLGRISSIGLYSICLVRYLVYFLHYFLTLAFCNYSVIKDLYKFYATECFDVVYQTRGRIVALLGRNSSV